MEKPLQAKVYALVKQTDESAYEHPQYPQVIGIGTTKQDALVMFANWVFLNLKQLARDNKISFSDYAKVSYTIDIENVTVESIISFIMETETSDHIKISEWLLEEFATTKEIKNFDQVLHNLAYILFSDNFFEIREIELNCFSKENMILTDGWNAEEGFDFSLL